MAFNGTSPRHMFTVFNGCTAACVSEVEGQTVDNLTHVLLNPDSELTTGDGE